MLSSITLGVNMLSVLMLREVNLSHIFCCYAEYRYAEWRNSNTERHYAWLYLVSRYAECHYVWWELIFWVSSCCTSLYWVSLRHLCSRKSELRLFSNNMCQLLLFTEAPFPFLCVLSLLYTSELAVRFFALENASGVKNAVHMWRRYNVRVVLGRVFNFRLGYVGYKTQCMSSDVIFTTLFCN